MHCASDEGGRRNGRVGEARGRLEGRSKIGGVKRGRARLVKEKDKMKRRDGEGRVMLGYSKNGPKKVKKFS